MLVHWRNTHIKLTNNKYTTFDMNYEIKYMIV